jgi:hypothetical protein
VVNKLAEVVNITKEKTSEKEAPVKSKPKTKKK